MSKNERAIHECHHVLKVIEINEPELRLSAVIFCPHCNNIVAWKVRNEDTLRGCNSKVEGVVRAWTDEEIEQLR